VDQESFILACGKCGQRIELKNGLSYDELIKKFSIISNDKNEILIRCSNTDCGNKIRF